VGSVIRGWASTVVIILFLGGVQLLTLGIVGEYISRIYDEVKQRPLFIVEDLTNLGGPASAALLERSEAASRDRRADTRR